MTDSFLELRLGGAMSASFTEEKFWDANPSWLS